MLLKDYIKHLQEVEAEHGGDLEVVYSSDAEGNSYHSIYYTPTVGVYDEDDEVWSDVENAEETFNEKREINSVCVN